MRHLIRSACVSVAALTAACGLAASSHANVTEYAVARVVTYAQTSNAAPTTPELWFVTAGASSDTPGEMLSASVSLNAPDPVSYPLFEALPNFQQFYSIFFTDSAIFLTDFPATTYTITVDRGFGPETGDLFLPEDNFCAEIPTFTGDTYDRLQNYDVSLPFDATINGFAPHLATNFARTILSLVRDNDVGPTWIATLEPGETTFQIPAGLLLPDSGYSLGVEYLNFTYTENAGFGGGAASGAEFYRANTVYFTTLGVPCDTQITLQPAAVSVDAGDTAALAVRAGPGGDCSLVYAWAKNGVPLADGPTGSGSTLLGASTHTLIITGTQPADAGDYTCLITSGCASLLSAAAALTVEIPCPADINNSGAVTPQDIFDFLAAFFGGCP